MDEREQLRRIRHRLAVLRHVEEGSGKDRARAVKRAHGLGGRSPVCQGDIVTR